MIIKLTARDGSDLFLNTEAVILAEEVPSGWLITMVARVLGHIAPGVRTHLTSTSRVLDLDQAGAAPLIKHLGRCSTYGLNP